MLTRDPCNLSFHPSRPGAMVKLMVRSMRIGAKQKNGQASEMKIFLTGGTGFIGLALAAHWQAQGAEVVSTAETPPPDWARAALPGVQFQQLDVRDRAALTASLIAAGPDLLVHGAALTPDENRERSGGTAAIFEVNVAGTANALEAAAKAGIKRVVSFSSGAVYGLPPEGETELDEAVTECRPALLYAISKMAAEKVALRLGALHGLSVVTPRLLAAWGPWEYRTSMRQTLSPGFQMFEAIMEGEVPKLPTDAAMPLIFSEDAATMIARLAESDAVGPVNIGTTEIIDLSALADEAVSMARARGLVFGGRGRGVVVFAPSRPPISLKRLGAAIGDWPKTHTTDALERYFDWHAGLIEPRPF